MKRFSRALYSRNPNLGKVLGALGRRSEAVDAMRAALALSPALVDAYLILAKNLDALGCYDEAIGILL